MAGDESVRPVLPGLGEAGQPPQLAQRVHLASPAGQNLVGIALVAHVEHQPIGLQIEHPVDGHRGLHNAQAGRQMAPGFGHARDDLLPQLVAQQLCLDVGEGIQLFGAHSLASSPKTQMR